MQHGAAGFSTSRTLMHRDLEGVPISGSYASREELIQIFAGMADGGGGLFEILEDFADVDREIDWMGSLSQAFRIPVSFALAAREAEDEKKLLKWMEDVNRVARTELITAQTAAKTQGSLQSLQSKYHPFAGHPTFIDQLAHLPHTALVSAMRSPKMKATLLSEPSVFADAPFARVIFNPANLFPLIDGEGVPRYERVRMQESFAALAKAQKVDAMSLIYDALVQGTVLWAPLEAATELHDKVELMLHKHVRIGLGDGGAHLGIFQEAGCPTFMIAHYARDRNFGVGRVPLERIIKMLTMDTANLCGLTDRGQIAVGQRADLNVIDLSKLNLTTPYVVDDLPNGAKRWMQSANGYKLCVSIADSLSFNDTQIVVALLWTGAGNLICSDRADLPELNVVSNSHKVYVNIPSSVAAALKIFCSVAQFIRASISPSRE
eukprot:m.412218 g.412218  ORF g.412218 m.412218 type:complete len:435 (-) comp21250_c0_seq17:4-1308(-)